MQNLTQKSQKTLQPNEPYYIGSYEQGIHDIPHIIEEEYHTISFNPKMEEKEIDVIIKEFRKQMKKTKESFSCPEEQHKEYAECVVWITHKVGESGQLTTWKIHSNKMLYCPICKRSLRKYILNKDNA